MVPLANREKSTLGTYGQLEVVEGGLCSGGGGDNLLAVLSQLDKALIWCATTKEIVIERSRGHRIRQESDDSNSSVHIGGGRRGKR